MRYLNILLPVPLQVLIFLLYLAVLLILKYIIMNVSTTIFRTAEDWSKQFFEGALSYDEQKEILIKSGLMIFDHKKNGATAKGSWINRTDGLFPPFLAGR